MLKIGIDIGTSNSSIAVYDGRDISVLPVSEGVMSVYGGEKRLSSAVYNDEHTGSLVIGQAAYNMRMKSPERFSAEFKREFGSDIPLVLGDKSFKIDDIYKAFFRKLVSFAQKAGDIREVYITHPAIYTTEMVKRLQELARQAGISNITMIDEPSAAATGYVWAEKENLKPGDSVLVYDFGGGTFDVSLIEKTETGFKHLTKPLGLSDCGGSDFDRLIFEDMLSQLKGGFGEVFDNLLDNEKIGSKIISDLLERAVKTKHQLSKIEEHTETVIISYDTFDYTLTRDKFNDMISPYLEQTGDLVNKIMDKALKKPDSISKVLLVGGTCNIPYIRTYLESIFGSDKVTEHMYPDLAVCMGAVISGEVKQYIADSPVFVTETLEGGDTYEGYKLNEKAHGKGRYVWTDGDIYEGDFVNGDITGKGKYMLANGDVYEGEFVNAVMNGKGKYTLASGDIYEGDFLNGNPTGKGKYIWTNGDMYEGEFVNGIQHGKGKYTGANGDIYEGDFADGDFLGDSAVSGQNDKMREDILERFFSNKKSSFGGLLNRASQVQFINNPKQCIGIICDVLQLDEISGKTICSYYDFDNSLKDIYVLYTTEGIYSYSQKHEYVSFGTWDVFAGAELIEEFFSPFSMRKNIYFMFEGKKIYVAYYLNRLDIAMDELKRLQKLLAK